MASKLRFRVVDIVSVVLVVSVDDVGVLGRVADGEGVVSCAIRSDVSSRTRIRISLDARVPFACVPPRYRLEAMLVEVFCTVACCVSGTTASLGV